ncbi:hypothetical protein [Defluviitalea saccharophila]|uniref:Sporulation membrane protein YtrI C-terminal domain-containing protein n=1 Tax=Defluviitalea saccharophila TaxID=879970 RepID=A0ABZ2Y6L9_9FIRM
MKKRNFSVLWIFIFGFLIGIAFYNTIYMSKIESLINENEYLSAQLEDHRVKLKKLEESNQKKETPVLNQISPIMLNKNEEFLPKNEIDQYIKVLLKNQIGKELNQIDVDLIYNGLNRRFLKFKDGEYQLEIRSIIVTDTMYIYYLVQKTNP